MGLQLIQKWKDNRISKLDSDCSFLAADFTDKIWMPKLYIYNMTKMAITKGFHQHTNLWLENVQNDTWVHFIVDFELTVMCAMDYAR